MRTSERQLFRARFACLCNWLPSDVCDGGHFTVTVVCLPALPPKISFFLLSLGGLLVEFWPLFKAMAHPKCGFRLVSPKRAHLSAPAFKNTTKIPRKDPKREREERMKFPAGERKKSAKFLAPPPFGPPPFGPSPKQKIGHMRSGQIRKNWPDSAK